ncbi:MAG: serine/threonine-protein kinase [Gemmatimonadota bacterium]|nr:serine/threonine-protein kinase [Gemmatimonadota bacterium]
MTDSMDKPLVQRLKEALGETYTIEGEIGRGGMGVVYRARDERLHRRVAIKVLPPELAFQKEIRERFTREAQTAARLQHPHIVPIHDVGEGNGLVYFVMGLVEGESLGGRIRRRGKLPAEEARRIMKETADALSAAHAVSVIHRDIKPDNILLEGTRGRVMVTDFGIAKALSAGSGATLTGVGVAIGTPSYMSPEQAAGERDVDGRSDVYSLGVVTYQMLTGELPFTAPTVAGILMKQITEPAPVLHEIHRDIPEDLSLAVSRCLEKDPEHRWSTADQLRRALESRTVTGYRPNMSATGTRAPSAGATAAARARRAASDRSRAGGAGGLARRSPGGLQPRSPGGALGGAGARPSRALGGQWVRNDEGRWVRRSENDEPAVSDTGEPVIVQKVRAQFARWAAVTGGCFLVNMATGLGNPPWFLFVAAGMGFPLLKGYAALWQAGYSWRDVLNRPPAPDAIQAPGAKAVIGRKSIPLPAANEFGKHHEAVKQVHTDRAAILSLVQRLSPGDREMLKDTDIVATTEGLYQKAVDMARALHDMDQGFGIESVERIEQQLEEGKRVPEGEERDRRMAMLQKQMATASDLASRRQGIADRVESNVLAMQNLRFDLLRLRSAGVGAVIGDLTQATQQARALSRDVDMAIAAAAEVREAIS